MMKKIIVFVLLLIITATSFSQQTNPVPKLTKADYLQKSKVQKNGGFISLGGGVVCIITCYLIPRGKETGRSYGIGIGDNVTYKNDGLKEVFFWAGFLSSLGSIPFFTSSHRSKKKAMRLSFKNETAPQLQNGSFTNRTVPSLALKISL